MWYDRGRLLSYNKLFNFVIGNRGGGKTYNAIRWCINDFKKNKKEFVWVRRYKTEFKDKDKFFNAIKEEFPNDELTVKGWTAYLNGQPFGYFVPLSTSTSKKSVPYPNVNKIIFDEFIIDKGSIRYLTKEVDTFLEFYETVARLRNDVRALFLANAISLINPYFLYFNIKPDLSKRFNIYNQIAVELYKNDEYIEQKKHSRFGELIAGTKYSDYAIDNQFFRDDYTFIEPFPKNLKFYAVIKYKSNFYGVWRNMESGIFYVNRKFDPYTDNRFTITKEDYEPDWKGLGMIKRTKALNPLVIMFETGNVRFDSIETKTAFYEFIQYLR